VTNVGSVLDAVRRTAEERIAPQAARIDRERLFPDDNLNALAEVGGLGLVVPHDHGGAGGALTALAEACETLGSACASTAMVFLMHSVTAATVATGGGPASEALAAMAGGTIGTLAFSERGTGAHFYAPELRVVRSNGGVRISGRKSFVTAGGRAGLYLVLVAGEAEGTADATSCAATTRACAPTVPGRGWGWPATRASRWSSRTSSSPTRTGSAAPARRSAWCSEPRATSRSCTRRT
jgi:alkylation response protein AidB-like acyl-CoA dehydrogenase